MQYLLHYCCCCYHHRHYFLSSSFIALLLPHALSVPWHNPHGFPTPDLCLRHSCCLGHPTFPFQWPKPCPSTVDILLTTTLSLSPSSSGPPVPFWSNLHASKNWISFHMFCLLTYSVKHLTYTDSRAGLWESKDEPCTFLPWGMQ